METGNNIKLHESLLALFSGAKKRKQPAEASPIKKGEKDDGDDDKKEQPQGQQQQKQQDKRARTTETLDFGRQSENIQIDEKLIAAAYAKEPEPKFIYTPVYAELPPRGDAISQFSQHARDGVEEALRPISAAETKYSVVSLGTYYELVVHDVRKHYGLSALEDVLQQLQKRTGWFVWDCRVQLPNRTILVSFLPAKPVTGELTRLPGIALLESTVFEPTPYEKYMFDDVGGYCAKPEAKPLPLNCVYKPEGSDAAMLRRVRDRLESMHGDYTLVTLQTVVTDDPSIKHSDWQVFCSGHRGLKLHELRSVALLFPYNVVDVECVCGDHGDIDTGVRVLLRRHSRPAPTPRYAVRQVPLGSLI